MDTCRTFANFETNVKTIDPCIITAWEKSHPKGTPSFANLTEAYTKKNW